MGRGNRLTYHRERIRRHALLGPAYRGGVFVTGLVVALVGIALLVLPVPPTPSAGAPSPAAWGRVGHRLGRLAQRESASFTPRRPLVRSQYRPPSLRCRPRRAR